MNPLRGWAPALRVARREATRARGRSALVLTMIALPVLAVTAADVVLATGDISGAEAVERRLGTADALVTVEPRVTRVIQAPDPSDGSATEGRGRHAERRTLADVEEALGRDVRAVEIGQGTVRVATDAGIALVDVTETDLTDDLTDGLYRLDEGRVPAAADEVAINHALAERGIALGEDFAVEGGPTLTVVGIGDNTSYLGRPMAVVAPAALDLRQREGQHAWLVDAGAAITWAEVRALNGIGAMVISRAVLEDPPPDSALDPELQGWATGGPDGATIAVVVLVVAMALLEVVLLAGPAFAVIARRLQRTLALMAANGAIPSQARRVVLASGLVLGSLGAALGVALGLGVAWLSLPLVQRFSDSFLGPFDVPWVHLVGIAGFGLASALLAAVVPAWLASRQDVVAVLAGRRGDARPSLRSPLVGLVLLGAGIAAAAYGATRPSSGEYYIAAAAIVAVLGMILLVPVVVAGLARVARGLPLPLRYAVRDAARHRTRTVPAVAAVAATVAGVVALGIANASDGAQSEATYTPLLAHGQASINGGSADDWAGYRAVAQRYLPEASVTPIAGVDQSGMRHWVDVTFRVEGQRRHVLGGWGSAIGTSVPISIDGTLPSVVSGLDAADRAAAEQALAAGGVVVFTDRGVTGERATVAAREQRGRKSTLLGKGTFPAAMIHVAGPVASFQGVLSGSAAAAIGVTPTTVGLLIDGTTITAEQEADVDEALAVFGPEPGIYVERGYTADDEAVIVLLVLGALGGVLMLGGTLTATFLSLSDARPDLATLSAVGASPRTRRAVAAAYALVIGLVGAVLGAAVGFVPGIAASYPLTGAAWVQEMNPSLPDHFLAVPWLLIGTIVVALPLLTAAVVGLCTRSRLPLVARVD